LIVKTSATNVAYGLTNNAFGKCSSVKILRSLYEAYPSE